MLNVRCLWFSGRSLMCMFNWKKRKAAEYQLPGVPIHVLLTNFIWLARDLAILCSKTHSEPTGTQVFLEGSLSLQVASVELPAVIYLTTCLNEGLVLMLFCGELFQLCVCARAWRGGERWELGIASAWTVRTWMLTVNDIHPMNLTWLPLS